MAKKALDLASMGPVVFALQEATSWTDPTQRNARGDGLVHILGLENKEGLRFALSASALALKCSTVWHDNRWIAFMLGSVLVVNMHVLPWHDEPGTAASACRTASGQPGAFIQPLMVVQSLICALRGQLPMRILPAELAEWATQVRTSPSGFSEALVMG